MPSLTRAEAAQRAGTIRVESYSIDPDLTTGPERFVRRSVVDCDDELGRVLATRTA